MKKIKRFFADPNRLLIFLLLIWWIVNLIQAAFTELHYDEAYYWMYSQNLAWGYFDHPPLIALLVRLGTFFNTAELGVRFFVTLLQPIYLYLFWKLVCPENATVRKVLLYILLCAAIPILEAYGIFAVPDAPLLFSTVVFLLAYKYFLKKDSFGSACLLGLSVALLGYSKYHGMLVVIFILSPNILKLLRNPRFYLTLSVAALAMLPHLLWLYNHDFVSLKYHLYERSSSFHFKYIYQYILNLVVCYHPYIFLLFIYIFFKRKPKDIFERGLYCMAAGFYLFFFFATFRGHVQPQWLLPTTFSMIYIVYRYACEAPKIIPSLKKVSYITILLLIAIRIFLMAGSVDSRKIVFFNNAKNNGIIADSVGDVPVLFSSSYSRPSMYMFYTHKPAATQLSIYGRSNQYMFWDYDTQLYGKTVAVESAEGTHQARLVDGSLFKYNYYDHYIPVRLITAEINNIPEYFEKNKKASFLITLSNPYTFDIPLGRKTGNKILLLLKDKKEIIYDIIMEAEDKLLKANGELAIETQVIMTEKVGNYEAYICIQHADLNYTANSKPIKITIR